MLYPIRYELDVVYNICPIYNKGLGPESVTNMLNFCDTPIGVFVTRCILYLVSTWWVLGGYLSSFLCNKLDILVSNIYYTCDSYCGKYSPESSLLWKIIPKGYALIRHYWKILGVMAAYRMPNSVVKHGQTRKFTELPHIILHEFFQILYAPRYNKPPRDTSICNYT